ncbi:MAG TPA: phosphodiester glycosidase family protein [Acidimicrobiales bacterium]|nr:phosphodiester glycosidase family protein [Acidimicrobiales bacterium]
MIIVALCTLVPVAVDVARASAGSTASGLTSGSGLDLHSISGDRYGVRTSIHVLTFSGPQYSLEVGLANHGVDGGLETPSTMCRSTPGCVAAVNGDFFDVTRQGRFDPGDEVGGVIQNCVLLHTPEIAHQQANLEGQSVNEGLNWSSSIDVNGVNVPITAVNQELPMRYLNVNLPLAGTLLFTSPFALRTPTAAGRLTYEFIEVNGTASPTTINTTAELELVATTTTPVRVTSGHVDVSAPAGSTLATLQVGDTVTLTTTSTAGCNNIGGHPILLNDGVVVPIDPSDTYMAKRYARTVIGWTGSGTTVIIMVAGRDAQSGATGYQLVRLLRSLKVVTALNLDGGNSTALYAAGRIYFHAGRVERPVSTGLLVVRNP